MHQAVAPQRTLLEPDKLDELIGIAEWAGPHRRRHPERPAGRRPRSEVWDEVSAEPDLCTRLKCRHFDRCFLFRARRRAAEADVVVVNHHLLAADLSVRQAQDNWQEAAVLPPYQRLVLDEAHHLEDVAAGSPRHSGQQPRACGGCWPGSSGTAAGWLPTLAYELRGRGDLLSRASLDLLQQRLLPAVADARRASEACSSGCTSGWTTCPAASSGWTTSFAADPIWDAGPRLRARCDAGRLPRAAGVGRDHRRPAGAGRRTRSGAAQLLQELRGGDAAARGDVRRAQPHAPARRAAVRPPCAGWSGRARGQHVALSAVPLDLAPVLRELLFDRLRHCGAHQRHAGGRRRVRVPRVPARALSGEDSPVTVREIFPSPFDYPSQCVFGIPNDLPEPREDEHGAWRRGGPGGHRPGLRLGRRNVRAVHQPRGAAAGRARAPRRRSAPAGRMLVQGEAPRDVLLRRFREAENAILLGTDSFWEGVDVPGRALRTLVLNKLPFKVPCEPITAARLERLAEEGQDGFMNYLLPHAALKLKQGFGRLIRSRQDMGVVVLLDSRVVTKRYGPLLLGGLPRAERIIGTWAQVRTKCEDFFARHGIGAIA